MQEKEKSRRRRKSRRKSRRRRREMMTTITQRVKSAIFFKETEPIPSAKIVKMTMNRTAPWTSPSRKRKGKNTMKTTSQMLRMTLMRRTKLTMKKMHMRTMKVTWKT